MGIVSGLENSTLLRQLICPLGPECSRSSCLKTLLAYPAREEKQRLFVPGPLSKKEESATGDHSVGSPIKLCVKVLKTRQEVFACTYCVIIFILFLFPF